MIQSFISYSVISDLLPNNVARLYATFSQTRVFRSFNSSIPTSLPKIKMAIKTFNRARAFGLILLFALPVAAAGIAYWQQFWWSQQITFRSTSDASFKIQITKMGLMNVYTKTTFYDTTGNATSSTDATIKWYDMAQQTANGCDMKCRLMNICGPLQVAATAVGLATWAMWLIMMIFNKLKHGLLATTGIWIMGNFFTSEAAKHPILTISSSSLTSCHNRPLGLRNH